MKLSIIIAVLNSHKVVIRQIRHFKRLFRDDDAELIIVDDGSNPPIDFNTGMRNYTCLYTNDKRPWTQGLARNLGAKHSKGQYLLFTDIDHIITDEAIQAVLWTGRCDAWPEFDKMSFQRYFGILDRYGNIVKDKDKMIAFGVAPKYIRRNMSGGVHGNTYAIKKSIFEMMGGYNPKYCEQGFHMGGKHMSEERDFNRRYNRLVVSGKVQPQIIGPNIYVYPTSKFRMDGNNNPFGLFHSLSHEQTPQPCKN